MSSQIPPHPDNNPDEHHHPIQNNKNITTQLFEAGYDSQCYPLKPSKIHRRYEALLGLDQQRPCEFIMDPSGNPTIVPIKQTRHIAAALVYSVGEVAATPCYQCTQGCGPYEQCVIYKPSKPETPYFQGACSNCYFNQRGESCSLRKFRNLGRCKGLNTELTYHVAGDQKVEDKDKHVEVGSRGGSTSTALGTQSSSPPIDPLLQSPFAIEYQRPSTASSTGPSFERISSNDSTRTGPVDTWMGSVTEYSVPVQSLNDRVYLENARDDLMTFQQRLADQIEDLYDSDDEEVDLARMEEHDNGH